MKQKFKDIFSRFYRRSSSANMYDVMDRWNTKSVSNLLRTDDYTDGFWKVFLLNDKLGGCGCSQDSSTHASDALSKSESSDVTNCYCMKHSKTSRRRRFKSQSGYYLAIMPNGQIIGIKDRHSPHINLDVIPVGSDLVKIWGVEAELFLMIDDQGQMRGTDVDSSECIFKESLTENFFNVYYSTLYFHKRWCIGLRNNNKQQSRSFYKKPKPTNDMSFIIEVVRRRPSTSSVCDSDDNSRVS